MTDPSKKFYKLFSEKYSARYPKVNFRTIENIRSVRHLEGEMKRDVLAYELGIKIE